MTQTSGAHLNSKSHKHLPLPRELKAEQLALQVAPKGHFPTGTRTSSHIAWVPDKPPPPRGRCPNLSPVSTPSPSCVKLLGTGSYPRLDSTCSSKEQQFSFPSRTSVLWMLLLSGLPCTSCSSGCLIIALSVWESLNYFCISASLRSGGSPEPLLITFTDLHFGMVPSPLLHEDLRPGKSPTWSAAINKSLAFSTKIK